MESEAIKQFDRHFFNGTEKFTRMGEGSIGGKAQGLARVKPLLESGLGERFRDRIEIGIPRLTVIATEFFDKFMKENNLYEIAYSDARDDVIAHAFQKAELPSELVGNLWTLSRQVHVPLAIRSSSMLEDAEFEPFASVYGTKLIPNNWPDPETRFIRLTQAIKYVYASTFFKGAKEYMQVTSHSTQDEKMAVIIQEVVGQRHGNRFYPTISGVARSYNFYPTGKAKPEDGVVDLALGLGRIIVDDGISWSYSPAHPRALPPFNSVKDLLRQTQTEFWAVNMGEPLCYDPINEIEYLIKCNLCDAEYDNTLRLIASTYIPADERIVAGVDAKGPRVINFAPILQLDVLPLNDVIKELVKACEDLLGTDIEMEFAVDIDKFGGKPAYFGFLQVRPMVVSLSEVDITDADLRSEDALVVSEMVVGNGLIDNISDVVYVKPESFDVRYTREIVPEIEAINNRLVSQRRPYILIGFGRWGTSDPNAGIPVRFGQIAGARVVVESTMEDLMYPLSQGSHFFHNVTSFKILYFSVLGYGRSKINWDFLRQQRAENEMRFVRHVVTPRPLVVKVDGRAGRGVILSG